MVIDAVVYDFCDRRQVTSYVPFTKRLPMSSAGKSCRRFRPGNERLEALESELRAINPKLQLFSRSLDLRNQDELERFCDWRVQSNLALDFLINNAGLGNHGPFLDSEWERINAMLQFNIHALTCLTFRALPVIKKPGRGAILDVSSIASFLPLPNSAVYAATKAYVTSFSKAVRAELRPSNVSITTLCPGPVSTEFLSHATRAGDRHYYHAHFVDFGRR